MRCTLFIHLPKPRPLQAMFQILVIVLYCLKFSVNGAETESKTETATYRAAVVEYYTVREGDNPEDIFNENANNYQKFVHKASEFNVDIIVFPESGLTDGRTLSSTSTDRETYLLWSSYIPDPKTSANPCTEDTNTLEAIKIVSCAARNYSMYVVVNLSEKESCINFENKNNCSDDGYLFYNTNVVFDRNGSIIARYRKYNLFGEIGFNTTELPDLTTFETDFGVTFGVFIAFDILFREPSLTLVRDLNVTDFVYNLHWYSALPFMTAVQTQMAWSYTMDVNLLASGYNRPIIGSGGSGIFAGRRGTVVSELPEKYSNLLLIGDVPIRQKLVVDSESQGNYSHFSLVYNMSDMVSTVGNDSAGVAEMTLRRDNLEPYTTMEIDTTVDEHDVELCDRGLCCHFHAKVSYVDVTAEEAYRYRFAVFNGVRDYSGIRTGGIQTCGILSCIGDDLASCGRRFSRDIKIGSKTVFENLTIAGDFPNDPDKLQIVQSLTDENLLPLKAEDIFVEIEERAENRSIKFSLLKPQDDLITFAIYGRNFIADGSDVTIPEVNNSASGRYPDSLMILFSYCLPLLNILG